MWIERDLEAILRRAARLRPVLLLTGARQTGKSALLSRIVPGIESLSLDLPSLAEQADRDAASFLSEHPAPLVIDEVQYAPGVFRTLKAAVDQRRSQPGQYFLTGSQKFVLMKEVSESLAGRVDVFEVEPLSLNEVLRHLKISRPELIQAFLTQFILRGGYPELWAHEREEDALDPYAFHRSYTTTYLERDLRQLIGIKNLRDFERLIRACAARSSQLLNKADLARDVGVSPPTVSEWLSMLEASNVITLLEPWFTNRTKSITKSPKLFFRDTGLLCFLLNIRSEGDLLQSPWVGAIWETFIFTELRKALELRSEAGQLYFYRDRDREIDFVIQRAGRFDLLEAKWCERPTSEMRQRFRKAKEAFNQPENRSAFLCRTGFDFQSGEEQVLAPIGARLYPPLPVESAGRQ